MRVAWLLLLLMFWSVPTVAQDRPGTLVSVDPLVDTPPGAQVWRISYWSRDDRDRPRRVTGMVLAPREAIPPRPRPVLAWTHGTWGISTGCAPSQSPDFVKATAAVDAVRRGYVVVAPDYQGLGSEGPHPFLVGSVAARNTLDAIRAAQAIPGAAAGRRFAVWGESQGGHAALWTGRETRSYAPELTLTGVAAAVPPTDLVANMREARDKNARAFFLAYIIDSWSDYYGIPMRGLVKPRTERIVRALADRCIVLGARPKLATLLGILTLRGDLAPIDLGSVRPWSRQASDNDAPLPRRGESLFIATSDGDVLVSSNIVRGYARRSCAAGARVRVVRLATADHVATTKETAGATLDWIDDRFAGRPAPSDCADLHRTGLQHPSAPN